MALQAGDVFGRYELVSWLGRGGMAETWRAQLVGDAGVTKPVLIKKVLPEYANDEAFISMFISEARISATLSHGNVAQVFDFGRVDGEYFLAMEFVDGQPLHRVLKRAVKSGLSALPLPVAVFIVMEMCRGLHYAHTRTNGSGQPLGIVHRDISPDNVLIGYEGQIKIVDFGIAKAQLIRGVKTAPGVVKGKYLFFSPEQARGEEVDARTDVWATGVVLYELLCGKLPVEGPPHVVMMRVGRGEIPHPSVLRPDLPKELNDIVMKALTPERERRFESSHAFGDALAGFLYSNFPRFSPMSIANLLRVLFRGDLAQEGRELDVPPSFLEEMKAWREPTAAPEEQKTTRRIKAVQVPAKTAPTQPIDIEPAPSSPRQWVYSLSAGSLLVVGTCAWLLMGSQDSTAAPPPSPIQAPKSTAVSDSPSADEASRRESADVWTIKRAFAEAINNERPRDAVSLSESCVRRFPQNEECHILVRQAAALNKAPPKPKVDTPPPPLEQKAKPSIATAKPTPEQVKELHRQAFELTLERRYHDALNVAYECITLDPSFPDCELSLGYLHAKLGNDAEAGRHYEKFLEIAPPDHDKRERVVKMLTDNPSR
jgi:eukaryotic-like serine/threonine-protein kinase